MNKNIKDFKEITEASSELLVIQNASNVNKKIAVENLSATLNETFVDNKEAFLATKLNANVQILTPTLNGAASQSANISLNTDVAIIYLVWNASITMTNYKLVVPAAQNVRGRAIDFIIVLAPNWPNYVDGQLDDYIDVGVEVSRDDGSLISTIYSSLMKAGDFRRVIRRKLFCASEFIGSPSSSNGMPWSTDFSSSSSVNIFSLSYDTGGTSTLRRA